MMAQTRHDFQITLFLLLQFCSFSLKLIYGPRRYFFEGENLFPRNNNQRIFKQTIVTVLITSDRARKISIQLNRRLIILY